MIISRLEARPYKSRPWSPVRWALWVIGPQTKNAHMLQQLRVPSLAPHDTIEDLVRAAQQVYPVRKKLENAVAWRKPAMGISECADAVPVELWPMGEPGTKSSTIERESVAP